MFSKPGYIALGDPFRAASAAGQRTLEHDAYKIGKHEQDFKPAKVAHIKVPKAAYPYMPLGAKP